MSDASARAAQPCDDATAPALSDSAHPEPVEPEATEGQRTLTEFTPVPRERMRRGGWSAERQRQFIELLAETGSVRAACRRMGVGEHHIYKLRRHPAAESFRRAWEQALDCGIARIEDAAMDRALNGVEQPLYHQGQLVGTRTVHNDRLLMFLLKNRAPRRFSAESPARGPDAIERMKLARLKQEWRAEWERENNEDEEEVRASIDAFLQNMRDNRMANMGPRTRAAWAEYQRIEAEERNTHWRLVESDGAE